LPNNNASFFYKNDNNKKNKEIVWYALSKLYLGMEY
jgi:hypothetical protein